MNRLKFLSVVLFTAILAGMFVVAYGDDDTKKDPAAEGTKAGVETCDCVSSVQGPDLSNLPNPPSSPTPPEGFNLQELFALDLEDMEVFLALPADVQAYLMNPEVIAWLVAVGNAIESAYEVWFMALGGCTAQVASKYEEFYSFDYDAFDEEIGFFSCFNFKNTEFQQTFLAAAMVCADEFPSF